MTTNERTVFPQISSNEARRTAMLAALASLAVPAAALAAVHEAAPAPVLVGLVLGLFVAVAAATRIRRGRISPDGAATASSECPRATAAADLSRLLLDDDGVVRASERFAEILASAVDLEAAVLYLRRDSQPELCLVSAAGAAPTASPADGDYQWRGLVGDGEELGRVGLRTAGRGPLTEEEDALVELLCAQLASALRIARYRACLEAQQLEIESLRRKAEAPLEILREEIRRPERFAEFVGSSESLQRALALIERTAPSEVSILITGETGTGKELAARAVHELSPRRDGPLVTVNCPAIPGPLAESELFGHERGAFTDAVAARPGQFELADDGTIFLDEVADLPLDIQAKLLRVLQEGEVRRVGGHRARPLNVRTIAATNRDLLALVRGGRFREDLYYRLAAVEVSLPPLRERPGDVPMLATFFLEQAARAYERQVTGFSGAAMAALSAYHWPGNVRQLHNVVHRAVLLSPGEVVAAAHLSEIAPNADERPASFGAAMRQEKRRRFVDALQQVGWNQSAAARLLGMSRSNFARMLRSLEIDVPERGARRAGVHQ